MTPKQFDAAQWAVRLFVAGMVIAIAILGYRTGGFAWLTRLWR